MDNSSRDRPPLNAVSPDDLALWCNKGNDIRRWKLVMRAISVFEAEGETGLKLNERARALIDTCPEPEVVVESFGWKLRPRSGFGNRSEDIAKQLSALSELLESDDQRVVTATEELLERAKKMEERERMLEQKEDENREQTFE